MYVIKINGTKFFEVKPAFYAKEMGEKVKKSPDLWYELIQPKELADKLKAESKGDYSSVWGERCSMCWDRIDKNTPKRCYRSEDNISWLCGDCFKDLCNMPQNIIDE